MPTVSFSYLHVYLNKYCKSICWSKITRFMDQHECPNLLFSNASIYWSRSHQNNDLKNMHLNQMIRWMTENNSSYDTVHLFRLFSIRNSGLSSLSKSTSEQNLYYSGRHVHLVYLLYYKVFDWQECLTIISSMNHLHPLPTWGIATKFYGHI